MDQESCLADEIVIVLGDSEIVDCGLIFFVHDRGDSSPLSFDRLDPVADPDLSGLEPRPRLVSVFHPEGMTGTRP